VARGGEAVQRGGVAGGCAKSNGAFDLQMIDDAIAKAEGK
jgi:hypothetical protein